MGLVSIGGKCLNTSTFKRGGSTVNIKGFDISQPHHVKMANQALRNANGGTINLALGKFAKD